MTHCEQGRQPMFRKFMKTLTMALAILCLVSTLALAQVGGVGGSGGAGAPGSPGGTGTSVPDSSGTSRTRPRLIGHTFPLPSEKCLDGGGMTRVCHTL